MKNEILIQLLTHFRNLEEIKIMEIDKAIKRLKEEKHE